MKYFFLLLVPFLSFSQQTAKVDFIKCNALVRPNFETKSVYGEIGYDFKVKSEVDSIKIPKKSQKILRQKKENTKFLEITTSIAVL